MEERKALLEQLINLSGPLEKIMDGLRSFGWDWHEKELVSLTADDISRILFRYLYDELSEQEVEDWANAVEMREDILFGTAEDDAIILEAIHDLANPALEGPLTPESARQLLHNLKHSSSL